MNEGGCGEMSQRLPQPVMLPSLNSPSYFMPSLRVNTPNPSKDPFLKSPSYLCDELLPAKQQSRDTLAHSTQLQHAITEDVTQPTRMWANAQRDGRPAEYRWRPLFNQRRKVSLTRTTAVQ